MRTIAMAAFLLVLVASPLTADVVKITIDGVIHPIAAEYVKRGVDEATKTNAKALLIELRTPGGLETSTREIVQSIIGSRVPVIVWVAPSGSRAASAGFFILESADIAAMAPGTNSGAAHPVVIGGEKIDDVMKQKMENDSAAFMRSIAVKRGRNVELAENAVRQSKSYTEAEALRDHLIDYVAGNERELLRVISAKPIRRWNGTATNVSLVDEKVTRYDMTLRQMILSFLMDPNIAFILLALGAMSLWAEFTHPGAILPGVVGTVAILLAVFALNLLPTRFAALALLLGAFVLFALEAKYVSHGILGAGGVVLMTVGALLLVDGPIPEMRVSLITALAVSIPLGLIAVFLMKLAYEAMQRPVVTGEQGMIGELGVARTPISPEGKVFVHGEIWNAIASDVISEGERIRVVAVDGLQLKVEPVR
jgi:membrane-bound serine protease (ClpP class)